MFSPGWRCRSSTIRPWMVTRWWPAPVRTADRNESLANNPPGSIAACGSRWPSCPHFHRVRPPAGADAVVMQEDVRAKGPRSSSNENVEPGDFIRRRGVRPDARGKKFSKRVRAFGRRRSLCWRRKVWQRWKLAARFAWRLSLPATNLLPPGGLLGAGQIFESNSFLLRALLEKSGVARRGGALPR